MPNPFTGYDIFAHLASGFAVLAGSAFAFNKTAFVETTPEAPVILILVLVAYVTGHTVAEVSSLVLERLLVQQVLGSPERLLLTVDPDRSGRAGLLRSYFEPIHPSRARQIEARRLRENLDADPRGIFWMALPEARKDPLVAKRLEAFLNVYGFCRNMCVALLTVALLLLIGSATKQTALSGTTTLASETCLLAGALIMLVRYLKYYRLFTLEVLLAYR